MRSSTPVDAAATRGIRIACVIHSLDGGGAERVMAALASRLSRRGHHVSLITMGDGQGDRHTVDATVHRVNLGLLRPSHSRIAAVGNNLSRLRRLRAAIRATRPDVVLSFCDRTNVLTLLAMLATRIPVIVSERSDPASQRMPATWEWLRRRLYRHAADVIVLTPAAANTVAAWLRQPATVIPSAVEPPPETHDESPLSAADPGVQKRLIAVGRLESEKGFDRLLDAFAMIADRFPDWELSIHGEGSLSDDLHHQRDRLGLAGRVRFPGWTRPIWPALAVAELFVLPSRYEGFPSALLEAMAAGRACIAFDCPSGPAAIIRDGQDGLLVPADDVAALAAAIASCLADSDLRGRLGDQARSVIQRFGWEPMVDAYEARLIRAATERNR